MPNLVRLLLGLCVLTGLLGACATPIAEVPSPAPTAPPLSKELVYYDWADDIPQSVLNAFTAEYGVKITYVTYDSPEAAVKNLRAGQHYDVVAMENEFVPPLVADGLLAEIDHRNVPNFKNISANFRDLAYDPHNRYTVPFTWGTTGLVVRSDLTPTPVTRWADLWNARYAGKQLIWNSQRNLIGIALKSLGYSVNSENPAELDAALRQLLTLKAHARTSEYDTTVGVQALGSGEAVIMYGWAGDAILARARNQDISYVLPAEGAILWGDNYIIPANSSNKYTAELFINFVLRPTINAQIPNEIHYATPNDAARPFIKPDILNDPVIFAPVDALKNAEIILPLSPTAQKLYDDIWQRYLAAET